MNPVKFCGNLPLLRNLLQSRASANCPLKLPTAIMLAAAAIVSISISSSAERPSAAHVVNMGMPESEDISSEFWIQRDGDSRGDSVVVGSEMTDGGILSVPTAAYWAAFAFVGGGDSYNNLLVKTHDRGIYTFPCQIRGNFIVGWSGPRSPESGSRACSQADRGIEIDRSSIATQVSLPKPPEHMAVVKLGRGIKQNTDSAPDANLSVEPGQGQAVIRITSRPHNTYTTQYPLVECTPDICTEADGAWIRLEERIAVETEQVSIEVLEGAIVVKPEGKSTGTAVDKGQRYSYPGEETSPIDVDRAANSCEMLQFLNPAYWSSEEMSSTLATGIAAQLKQHREALGVSGRPPTNLSALEQEVLAELNRARTEPTDYADLIEREKQALYTNWLQLRGYSLDPNERRRLVDEAISFLRQKESLPELSVSDGMSKGNRDHVIDQGRSGRKRGHTGDNFSGPGQRLRAYGVIGCGIRNEDNYENVVYVGSPTARRVVIEMLIRDNLSQAGYEDAGDRDNLFNPNFQVIGVACGSHAYLQNMCVISYAAGYLEGS